MKTRADKVLDDIREQLKIADDENLNLRDVAPAVHRIVIRAVRYLGKKEHK